MNKQEYLSNLAAALKGYDPEIQQEILTDYTEHFRIGEENGKSEAEIIASLGDIQELIDSLGAPASSPEKQASNTTASSNKPVKTVVLDSYIADVEVIASSDHKIQADYINYGTLKEKMMFLFHGEQVGDVFYLKLEQANKHLFNWHSFTTSKMVIKLAVPAGLGSLEIKAVSGDTSINDIQIDSLKWGGASGDFCARNCVFKEASVSSASGDVSIENSHGTYHVTTASGDISVTGHQNGFVKLNSASGDIEYQGNSKEFHGNSTSGDIDVKMEQDAAIQLGTVSGDCLVALPVHTAGLSLKFKSLSGEFYSKHRAFDAQGHRISYQSETKGTTLSISTVSGDATLREC